MKTLLSPALACVLHSAAPRGRLASGLLAGLLAGGLWASTARATFHLWDIQELYSNSDGTLQFIEFFTSSSSQQFLSGHDLVSANVGNSLMNTLIFGSNLTTPPSTAGRTFLVATPAFSAQAGFSPDYTVPSGFLFIAGGTLDFGESADVLNYSALPTDGVLSRLRNGTDSINSPKNFAGQTATLVPEPGTWTLFGLGGLGLWFAWRRRAS